MSHKATPPPSAGPDTPTSLPDPVGSLATPPAGPGAADLGLRFGGRAPIAEAALPAALSSAGLLGPPPTGQNGVAPAFAAAQPLPGRNLDTSHSARPGPHSLSPESCAAPPGRCRAAGLRSRPAPRCTPLRLAGDPRSSDAAGFYPKLTSSRRRHLLLLSSAAEAGAAISSD